MSAHNQPVAHSATGGLGSVGGAPAHPSHRAVAATFTKLEGLLDRAMGVGPDGSRVAIDDQANANAKGRMLLELSRLTMAKDANSPEALVVQARSLRAKLVEEQRMLKRRMDAAEVISGLIADAVLAQEWDGTYEPRGALTAPGPLRAQGTETLTRTADPSDRRHDTARTRDAAGEA